MSEPLLYQAPWAGANDSVQFTRGLEAIEGLLAVAISARTPVEERQAIARAILGRLVYELGWVPRSELQEAERQVLVARDRVTALTSERDEAEEEAEEYSTQVGVLRRACWGFIGQLREDHHRLVVIEGDLARILGPQPQGPAPTPSEIPTPIPGDPEDENDDDDDDDDDWEDQWESAAREAERLAEYWQGRAREAEELLEKSGVL